MLYFCMALYPEAGPVITRFQMKPAGGRIGSVYASDEAILVLTGIGPVAAAGALSEALTLFPPAETDMLINIGICGAPAGFCEAGTWLRIHKITDAATGRDFYPEILFPSVFREAALATVSTPMKASQEAASATSGASVTTSASAASAVLSDMEASALYQTGQAFFSPERMLFYKGVSDFGVTEGTRLNPSDVTALIEKALPDILSEAEGILSVLPSDPVLSEAAETAVTKLCKLLSASVTMEHEIRLLAAYRTFRCGDAAEFFMAFAAGIEGPVVRREGKRLLEQLRKDCLA